MSTAEIVRAENLEEIFKKNPNASIELDNDCYAILDCNGVMIFRSEGEDGEGTTKIELVKALANLTKFNISAEEV